MKADNNAKTGSLGAREAIRLAVLASLGSLALVIGSFAVASADGGGVGPGGGGGESKNGTGDRYDRAWDNFKSKDRKWARRVGYCESGNDPDLHADAGGDRYHGAFMFLIDAWRNSPMSPGGDPHQFSWKTQAVVAVKLKHQMGTQPWPACG